MATFLSIHWVLDLYIHAEPCFLAWPTEDKQKLKKRLLFYIPFYIFIAGLFYAWVAIFHAVEKANSDGEDFRKYRCSILKTVVIKI